VRMLSELPVRAPSLREIEDCDAVLVLGEDVLATAPRLALALRQSVRNRAFEAAQRVGVPRWDDGAVRSAAQQVFSPLYLATPTASGLEDIAAGCWHGSPDELARFGFAIAHELDTSAPAAGNMPADVRRLASAATQALREARAPLVVSGAGCRSEAVLHAAANVALALHRTGKHAALSLAAPECNSLGLALIGGLPLADAFARVRDGRAGTLIVLENDLYRRAPHSAVDELLGAAHLIVIDHTAHATAQRAEVCLPAETFAEGSGTLVSVEGRAQRFLRAVPPEENVRDSWRWIGEIASACSSHTPNPWPALDPVTRACARAHPLLQAIVDAAPPAGYRTHEQKVPRQPLRYSGRTAMRAQISVHEPKPPGDPDSPLAFSMEGDPGEPPPALVTHFWAPGWNSYQAVNKFQSEIPGPLRGGPPGVRLLEPGARAEVGYFTDVPPPFRARPDALLLIPRYVIFGSEELSMLAPAVAQRAGRVALLLNPEDARHLDLSSGAQAQLRTPSGTCRLPVLVDAGVPPGTAAVPVGLPDVPWLTLPDWGELRALSQPKVEAT